MLSSPLLPWGKRAPFDKSLLPIPIGFLLLLASPVQAASCGPYTEPTVRIAPSVAAPRFDNTRSLEQLRQMAGQPDIVSPGVKEMPVGLTAARLKVSTSFEVASSWKRRDSDVCSQISHLNLELGFDQVTVYLARELPYGSCEESEVRAHELRHVQKDRDVLAAFLPRVQAYMESVVLTLGQIQAPTTKEAEARFNEEINGSLSEILHTMSEEREAAQKQIDTEAEYRRLSGTCNGALQRLIESSPN